MRTYGLVVCVMEKPHIAVAQKAQPRGRADNPERGAQLQALRRQVRALEVSRPGRGGVSLGPVDGAIGGGLARGAAHEAFGGQYLDGPSAAGFALMAAARALGQHPGALVWVGGGGGFDFGGPYGPGWARLGIDPGRVVFVRARDRMQALGALEEAARTPGIACAAGGLEGRVPAAAGRRLQLAAEAGDGFVIAWRPAGAEALAGARSRWRVRAVCAPAPEWARRAGLEGRAAPPGGACFELTRLRGRGEGQPIFVEWRDAAHGFHSLDLVADRAPARAARLA